jgi:hypothetical protein
MVRPFEQVTLSKHRSSAGSAGLVVLAIFTLIGLALGAFMMYVGWQHNSQGEFYDETGVHWGYWFLIGLSWFLLITGIPYVIALCVFLWRCFTRRSLSARSTPTI